MDSWFSYAGKIRRVLLLIPALLLIAGVVLFLYDLPVEPVLYGAVLWCVAGLASFCYGHRRYRKRQESLEHICRNLPYELDALPEPEDTCEARYQEMLQRLNGMRQQTENERQQFYREMTDYYTLWVHQIKTPISALRLLLEEEEIQAGACRDELFQIEQYVEMVLGYLRTEDISSDMNFSACRLDAVIREQIYKYARIFVGKKLSLRYEGVEETVLTDPKWLGFVISLILSNSLKYTKAGGISIYMAEEYPHTLVIEDTGIGIPGEDLPRVFEKGFTGSNGRTGKPSTGIGLYLAKKILKKLNHGIFIRSAPGEGTRVYLHLGREKDEDKHFD